MEFPWFAKVLKVAKRWQEAVEIFALAQNRQLGRHVKEAMFQKSD
jgi:hypothetical protein